MREIQPRWDGGEHWGGEERKRRVLLRKALRAREAAERGLTEVGELHSLTDWQVSEASEDAELEDFCHAGRPRREPERERRGGQHPQPRPQRSTHGFPG